MKITAENIEVWVLDAAEGRLSAEEKQLVEAAVLAHPEWGIDWESDLHLNVVASEEVVFEHKDSLKHYVIDDTAIIAGIVAGKPTAVLSKRTKRALKQQERAVFFKRPVFVYLAAAAVFAGMLFMPQLYRTDVKPAETVAMESPVKYEAPNVPTLDTLKPLEFIPLDGVIWDFSKYEGLNYANWMPGCGGVIYQDNWQMLNPIFYNNGIAMIDMPTPLDSNAQSPELAPNLAQMNQDSAQWKNATKLDSLQIAALEEKAMRGNEPRTLAEWVKDEANERITQLKGKHEIVLFKNRHRKNGKGHFFELEWKNLAIAF